MFRELLKQNRFTRHCSRITNILRCIEREIFLTNTPLEKQGSYMILAVRDRVNVQNLTYGLFKLQK